MGWEPADGVDFSLSLKAWEPEAPWAGGVCPSSVMRQNTGTDSSAFFMYLGSQWIGWCLSGEVKCCSLPECPIDRHRNTVYPSTWVPHPSVQLTHKTKHSTHYLWILPLTNFFSPPNKYSKVISWLFMNRQRTERLESPGTCSQQRSDKVMLCLVSAPVL